MSSGLTIRFIQSFLLLPRSRRDLREFSDADIVMFDRQARSRPGFVVGVVDLPVGIVLCLIDLFVDLAVDALFRGLAEIKVAAHDRECVKIRRSRDGADQNNRTDDGQGTQNDRLEPLIDKNRAGSGKKSVSKMSATFVILLTIVDRAIDGKGLRCCGRECRRQADSCQ